MRTIRKRVYLVLKALYRGDTVFHVGCIVEDISPRVRNEIYELRSNFGIKIKTTSSSNYGKTPIFYFLEPSKENYKKVKILLTEYENNHLSV